MPIKAEFTHIYDSGGWWVDDSINDDRVFCAASDADDLYKRLMQPHLSTYVAPHYISAPDPLSGPADLLTALSLPTSSDGKISFYDEVKYRNRECWGLDK